MMLENRLEQLGYKKITSYAENYIKSFNNCLLTIVINNDVVLYGYIDANGLICEEKQIADLYVGFWQLQRDLKELRDGNR